MFVCVWVCVCMWVCVCVCVCAQAHTSVFVLECVYVIVLIDPWSNHVTLSVFLEPAGLPFRRTKI